MLYLREYRAKAERLFDHLPWAILIGPGLVLNKDGGFQKTLRFRGPDLASATEAGLVAVRAQLNNALRRLGSRWCLHIEALRAGSQDYPPGAFPDLVSALIDDERRAAHVEHDNRIAAPVHPGEGKTREPAEGRFYVHRVVGP